MSIFRIALANVQFPATPRESLTLAEQAIAQASTERADLICFPECFIPGYRGMGRQVPPPDPVFLERAWSVIAAAGAKANLAVVLGTERVVDAALLISALVTNRDGTIAGFQDKVQLDPSEEGIYSPGSARRVFQTGPLTFGVVIRGGRGCGLVTFMRRVLFRNATSSSGRTARRAWRADSSCEAWARVRLPDCPRRDLAGSPAHRSTDAPCSGA